LKVIRTEITLLQAIDVINHLCKIRCITLGPFPPNVNPGDIFGGKVSKHLFPKDFGMLNPNLLFTKLDLDV